VACGELGMKSGKGFRTWLQGEPAAVRERLLRYLAAQADAREGAGGLPEVDRGEERHR
jgi:hypothetical protein